VSNRTDLERQHATLAELVESLDALGGTVRSAYASTQIELARSKVIDAEKVVARLLVAPVEPAGDPLDLPPWPDRWGPELVHDGGPRPEFVGVDEWAGHPDSFAGIAGERAWPQVRTYRLRADHPHYSQGARS
jgi:hypothetical protein